MRLVAFVLSLSLLGGCGSSSRAAAIKSAEIQCLKDTLASALAKLSQAAQQGSLSTSKTAIAIELTADELACAAKALAATSSSSAEGK